MRAAAVNDCRNGERRRRTVRVRAAAGCVPGRARSYTAAAGFHARRWPPPVFTRDGGRHRSETGIRSSRDISFDL